MGRGPEPYLIPLRFADLRFLHFKRTNRHRHWRGIGIRISRNPAHGEVSARDLRIFHLNPHQRNLERNRKFVGGNPEVCVTTRQRACSQCDRKIGGSSCGNIQCPELMAKLHGVGSIEGGAQSRQHLVPEIPEGENHLSRIIRHRKSGQIPGPAGQLRTIRFGEGESMNRSIRFLK